MMLAVRNLFRRKARSLFAVLQIAVAIASFLAIWGVVQGLRGQFYLLAQTVCEVGGDRHGRSMKHSSTLDTDDGQAYDHRGRE